MNAPDYNIEMFRLRNRKSSNFWYVFDRIRTIYDISLNSQKPALSTDISFKHLNASDTKYGSFDRFIAFVIG